MSFLCYRLEKEGNMDRAMRCYREALADNPEEDTARVRLDILTAAAEKQVCVCECLCICERAASELGCAQE